MAKKSVADEVTEETPEVVEAESEESEATPYSGPPAKNPDFIQILESARTANNAMDHESAVQRGEAFLTTVSLEFGPASQQAEAVRREVNQVRNQPRVAKTQ